MGKRMKQNRVPELKVRRPDSKELQAILDSFEKKHGMSSKEFYVKYNRGQLKDDREFTALADYMKWAAYYDMAAKAGLVNAKIPA